MEKVGISDLANRGITEVSGGQLQRACICRAVMNAPGLLLADEPTGALNKAASDEVMEEFVKLNRGEMSILIVTHDNKIASRCDRVCYMTDGKITGEYVLGKYREGAAKEREGRLNGWLEENRW